MLELRRHSRSAIDVPVEFVGKGASERFAGRAKDISLGGMFIETADPLPFAAEVTVHVTLPSQKTAFALPGVVRWNRDGGMGVQFAPMGARETHAITELTRAP